MANMHFFRRGFTLIPKKQCERADGLQRLLPLLRRQCNPLRMACVVDKFCVLCGQPVQKPPNTETNHTGDNERAVLQQPSDEQRPSPLEHSTDSFGHTFEPIRGSATITSTSAFVCLFRTHSFFLPAAAMCGSLISTHRARDRYSCPMWLVVIHFFGFRGACARSDAIGPRSPFGVLGLRRSFPA